MQKKENRFRRLIPLALSGLLWWALVIVLLFALLAQQTAAAAAPKPGQVAVLLILDNSSSMLRTDPREDRFPAAQLFVSLLDEGDAVGMLAFSDQSLPLTNGMVTIQSEADKESLIWRLQPLPFGGATDVKAVFEDAQTLLARVDRSTHQPLVVFLTDGRPAIQVPYPAYEDEALAAARALDVPVLAIGVTSAAQTPFLTRLAAETGGAVIPAADAAALLDAYLETLSRVKDRVVMDGGRAEAPGQLAVTLDPGLAPYVEKASFVIERPESVQPTLVDPAGVQIQSGGGAAVFAGPRFTVVTVERPAAGEWRLHLDGEGAVRVRTILRSRLRIEVTAPRGLHEAGQPMPIEAHLLEEQPDGRTVAIVGEASFSAQITRPDGRIDSLDRFYDDGSHGDGRAGDGIYSRLYVNADLPGAYTIVVDGRKGAVPVAQVVRVEAVSLPGLVVDEPGQARYAIRAEPVTLRVHLADGSVLDQGDVVALVTAPSGAVHEVPLPNDGAGYAGAYLPDEDGPHTVRFGVRDGFHAGLVYNHTAEAGFEAVRVPALAFRAGPVDWGRIERAAVEQGLVVDLQIASNSRQVENVNVRLEELPDFALVERGPFPIAAEGETNLKLHLVGRPDALGPFQGRLVFTARDGVDVAGGAVPVAGEIFQPTLRVRPPTDAVVGCSADLVTMLTVESTSTQTETLQLALAGPDGILVLSAANVSLDPQTLDVGPGTHEAALTVTFPQGLPAGEHAATLTVLTRAGLPVEGGPAIPLTITVPPLWSRCRGPVAAGGLGLLVILVVVGVAGQRIWKITRPALCQGTLRHWPTGQETLAGDLDLTALRKRTITIGSGDGCDLIIPNASLAERHARLRAEKANGGVRVVLEPQAEVQRGYQIVREAVPLQDGDTFTMGAQTFQYHSDPV